MVEKRKLRKKNKVPFEDKDKKELASFRRVLRKSDRVLKTLPPHQYEWFLLWSYVIEQREGTGLALGALKHDVVELDLRRKGYRDHLLDYTMDIILNIDSIYREFANEERDKKDKTPKKADGLRTMVEGRQAEMDRGSMAV